MFAIETYRIKTYSKNYNYESCSIPLRTNLNVIRLEGISKIICDTTVCRFIEYGFPIGYDTNQTCSCSCMKICARDFPKLLDTSIKKKKGMCYDLSILILLVYTWKFHH